MNDKFLGLLKASGWESRERRTDSGQRVVADYVKTYQVKYGDTSIDVPVAVYFYNLNRDNIPTKAIVGFALKSTISPNNWNRTSKIVGAGRVVATLDLVGYMTAVKFVVYGNAISFFTKAAKVTLESANKLPI